MGTTRDAAAVYRELAPAVLGYVRGQGVSDAEDVLGEVFYQVARDLHRVRGDDGAVRRWVFTVARNRVVDDVRRRARQPKVVGGGVPDVAVIVGDAGVAEELTDPVLVVALAGLTAEQREVVLLRFVADLPLEAVARITHRRVGAVKALQHRALAQLAVAVSPASQPALKEV